MRRVTGVFFMVVLIAGLSVASEKARNESASSSGRQQFTFSQDSAGNRIPKVKARPFVAQEFRGSDGDNVCYTMRSLIVAKESGSDVTHFVGQRTCTPSSRFRMNHSAPTSPKFK